MTNNSIRSLQIGNVLFYIAVVVVNFLSNSLPINNATAADVSNTYAHVLVPAGFTFAIWGIIYLLLLLFCIYQVANAKNAAIQPVDKHADKRTHIEEVHSGGHHTGNPVYWAKRIGLLFIASCILNISWLVSWHHYRIGLCLALIILYWLILLLIYIKTSPLRVRSAKELWLVSVPFSIYLGWLTIATLENLSSWLVSIGKDNLGLAPLAWAIINVALSVIAGLFFRSRFQDRAYPLVIAWALFGIAARQYSLHGINDIIITAGVGICIMLGSVLIPAKKIRTN